MLSYPFVFEPLLRLRTQGSIWSGVCTWYSRWCADSPRGGYGPSGPRRSVRRSESNPRPRPTAGTVLFWLGLSACGSTLLVATTNQISQDIAVSPFLWVAALAIYLLTFVLAFESDRFYRRTLFAIAAGLSAPVACVLPSVSIGLSLRLQLVVYLIALFVTCMICQGELARSRPSPRYLTNFYLTIAAGGALGGVFVALIAPRIFTEFSEYPIGLAAACLLGFVGWLRTRRAGSMDQPQFRRAPASDGVVDRRIDRDGGYRDDRQTRRCGERPKLLRHPARDGARRWQRAVSRTATRPHAARIRISAGRAKRLADVLLWAAQRHRHGAQRARQTQPAHRRGRPRRRHVGGVGTRRATRFASTKSIRMWSGSRGPGFSS